MLKRPERRSLAAFQRVGVAGPLSRAPACMRAGESVRAEAHAAVVWVCTPGAARRRRGKCRARARARRTGRVVRQMCTQVCPPAAPHLPPATCCAQMHPRLTERSCASSPRCRCPHRSSESARGPDAVRVGCSKAFTGSIPRADRRGPRAVRAGESTIARSAVPRPRERPVSARHARRPCFKMAMDLLVCWCSWSCSCS